MQDKTTTLTSLPWLEVIKLFRSVELMNKLSAISTETLEYIVEEDNYQTVVESALESIKQTEPEKANIEYAAKIADFMIMYAMKLIKEKKVT